MILVTWSQVFAVSVVADQLASGAWAPRRVAVWCCHCCHRLDPHEELPGRDVPAGVSIPEGCMACGRPESHADGLVFIYPQWLAGRRPGPM